MEPRDELVEYIRRQLVGPAHGPDEVLDAPPDRQYLMGTLYPQDADLQRRLVLAAEELDGTGTESAADDTNPSSDPVPESNSWLPSSLGISFYTDASVIEVGCGGAHYATQQAERGRRWQRILLPSEVHALGPERDRVTVLEDRAEIRLRRRAFGSGQLVTVSLVNTARTGPDLARAAQWDRMLFQVELTARPVGGSVLQYPSVRLASRDPEEQELRLQYQHVKTYAVGHGCAVEEQSDGSGRVLGLRAAVMPEAEVPGTRAAGMADAPVLNVLHLADFAVPTDQLRLELEEFTADYRAWYQQQNHTQVPDWGRDAAKRILARIDTAVSRMESGVRTLCDPDRPELLESFRAANRAMALQMRHSARDLAGERRDRREPVPLDPKPYKDASWRPFQLAFFLLALDGVADPRHPDRQITDLIWFSTGGGKTEAYLLLAAFAMVLRRREPGGAGTAVLSRYTLSLLTTQQFQRAATTVCALERLRRAEIARGEEPRTLGEEPFSIGLWVGEATSPNSYDAAFHAFNDVRAAAHPDDVFILDRCPWCGTRILPSRKSSDKGDYGVRAKPGSFEFYCPRDDCAFHDELPIAVVDEQLYDRPPTFVLGTVDKFARLAWEPRAGRLFGSGTGDRPPSLVIQDELHLLTGPLGTTVGVYESAVLGLCTDSGGIGPKVVASTATIRRSGEQVRALYGSEVQLFPPAGLDARYSYFAEPDTSRPGRRYLGVMAQGHTSGRAAVATAAAMLQGAWELPDEHRDDYWTLVAYHHSLRELGRTVTAAADDIPAQLAGLDTGRGTRALTDKQVQELTSNLARAEQPVLLDRLEKPWDDPQAVSFLPCTNMLSVGVDVKRLALMLMQGQPKTTAEYIQATSRVGRHAVPGLVLTFFNATRPRDRSHYETFDVYHRSLYRHVEPTSVTPWSTPSRRRALHAALVILVRHRLGLSAENQAGDLLDRLPETERLAEELAARAGAQDPHAAEDVWADLSSLLAEWEQAARDARAQGKELYYRSQGKGQLNLLKSFEQYGGLWETPNSMRNVDRECQVAVKGTDQ